jgi:hypothetical protein
MKEFIDSRYTKSDVRHSFKTKFGEVIDCIDFFAQPGVKALMARGIPITTAVPPSPEGSTSSSVLSDDAFNGQPDADGLPRSCPQESVPILRLTVDHIQAHGGLDRFIQHYAYKAPPPTDSRSLSQPETGAPHYAHVTITSNTNANITGMQDYLNILKPVIASPGYSHSISQIWIGQHGARTPCAANCEQTIEVGWNVDKTINSDANPHLFTFATSNGYGNGCYNNVNGKGGTCIPSSWIAKGATYTPGMALTPGAQTELKVFVKYDPTSSPGGPAWWAAVNGQYIESWLSSDFSAIPGTTMATSANYVLAGGEVEDYADEFAVQMGSGSAANATSVDGFGGVGTTGYHHDLQACTGSEGGAPCSYTLTGAPTPTMPAFYSFSQTGGKSSWNNYFFYGDAPGTFWGGLDYGFRRQNWPSEVDWAGGSYKGECGLGQPVTGLSKYGGAPAHAVLCGTTTITNYSQASCHGLPFYPSDNRSGMTDIPGLGDWDQSYVKGECAANEYVQGVAQNISGLLSTLYCCQGTVGHKSCDVQIFYSSNSPGYGSNPDWDPYYYKGQCPAGQYVAGVSAVYSASNGTPGAPHALLCCTP